MLQYSSFQRSASSVESVAQEDDHNTHRQTCNGLDNDIDCDSSASEDSDDTFMGSNYSIPPETFSDAIQTWPLEQWIHTRFCRTYKVHNWAHDRLARVLLFEFFCHRQTLPTPEDISITLSVARGLRRNWGDDIWALIEPLILVEGMCTWGEMAGGTNGALDFQGMSKEERGIMVFFSDATRDSLDPNSMMIAGPTAFQGVAYFLTDPVNICPDHPDIIGLTAYLGSSIQQTSLDIIDIPTIDPACCHCGKCNNLQEDLQRIPENFQMKYLAVSISNRRNGCHALEKAWNPLFTKAEEWVDSIMDRIECPFDFFPFISERRIGISVLEILINQYLEINSHFDTRQLLRFMTHLRYRHVWAEKDMDSPSEMMQDDFGFVTQLDPFHEDSPHIISAAGGWLYDIAGGGLDDQTSTIYFIPQTETFIVHFLSTIEDDITAIRMPVMEFTGPIFTPPDHATLDAPEVPLSLSEYSIWSNNNQAAIITVDLSWESIHGFPLLCDTKLGTSPNFSRRNNLQYDKYAAQISARYSNRIIRTWWRPQVVVGRPCTHRDDYSRMTRCSLTSKQVLLQVKPHIDPLSSRWSQTDDDVGVDDDQAEARETGSTFFRHLKDITSFLTGSQGPFERSRLCIVRCGDGDDSEEGPVDPLIILGASLGMKMYIIHSRECWNCACERMRAESRTLGIVTGTKLITKCTHCEESDRRAERIIKELGS